MKPTHSQSTLILVGHGSTLTAESAAPVFQHADQIRRRGIFGQVLECFWKQEPFICEIRHKIQQSRAFAVPFFISRGYFTQQIIPRELGIPPPPGTTRLHGLDLTYCEPIGVNAAMTDIILERAGEVFQESAFGDKPPDREITLFIAGHGTPANTSSRKAVEFQADRIREQNRFADVHAVFIEEEPAVGRCHQLAKTEHVLIVPFFASDGFHTLESIPEELGLSLEIIRSRSQNRQPIWENPTPMKGRWLWYAPSIGTHPRMAEVILEQVEAAAAFP